MRNGANRGIISSPPDLHFTQTALFWLSGHQPCAYCRAPLTLLQVSLFSSCLTLSLSLSLTLTHTHACMHVAHTVTSLQGPPIRQSLPHSTFPLPADWRTAVAREGRGRGELRGKTAGHMSRDLFTNPRQSGEEGELQSELHYEVKGKEKSAMTQPAAGVSA